MFSAIPSYATRNGTLTRNGDLVGGQLVPDSSAAPAPVDHTIASQLADSRAGSPNPALNVEDGYEDPVKLGLLPEDAVLGLFVSFHTSLNPVLALLDPTLHTPAYVHHRSRTLYTVILAAACKFFRPDAAGPVWGLAQELVGRALADGVCSVEYVQALVVLAFWGDRGDTGAGKLGGDNGGGGRKGGAWRKVGLAIRIAFELGLHLRKEGGREDELGVRERLNEERTWFHLACYDWTTALQRGKPRMILEEFFPREAKQWLTNHSNFPCNADPMLVTMLELVPHYNLYESIRAVSSTQNHVQLEPFVKHVIRDGERLLSGWSPESNSKLPPVSRSIIHFYHLRLRLILDELKLLTLFTPLLGTEHMVTLDCAHSALGLLRHVGEDVVPSGYLAYVQEFVPVSIAYAGAWLFKRLNQFDAPLRKQIIDTFRMVSAACRVQARYARDVPASCAMFFEHLVKSAGVDEYKGLGSGSFLSMNMNTGRDVGTIPPLEGMDATWLSAVDGVKDWWQESSFTGAPLGLNTFNGIA
ncbi:hypothetical protein BDV93DRAFT_610030 [Ceratobasidium sp. AG-I]|nr:hypothetical protein BDV93DRAFT_610030 [Ceratobasidium sp. AG-I]